MKRILGALLTLVACSFHNVTHAEVYRIGIVDTVSLPIVEGSRKAFIKELNRIMPEDDFEFVTLNAEGSFDKAAELVTRVIAKENIDLLVTVATLATSAAFNHSDTGTTPMLFMTVADPIGEGVVNAFGQTSAKNITGQSHVLAASVKLDMLDGLLSATDITKPVKIALVHSSYPSSRNLARELLALDSAYPNVEFINVSTPFLTGDNALSHMSTDIVDQLAERAQALDGYWLSTGPLSQAEGLIEAIYAKTSLLPIFGENITSVQQGALMGVVSDVESIGQTAANTAKRILQGENPNSIPVKRMDKYTMAVNISTAITLSIPIPSAYLKLAKHHVYQ